MRADPMPWRVAVACGLVGMTSGSAFGFFRGLQYLPTLPLAIIEGGILFTVPALLLGMVLSGGWCVATAIRRRHDVRRFENGTGTTGVR
jgi:hypothetical protein